jgi:hypothetical protein
VQRAGLAFPTIWTPFPSWFLRLCKETAPAPGEAGAVVQCAGREEKTDTTSICAMGGRFPIIFWFSTNLSWYSPPQRLPSRSLRQRLAEQVAWPVRHQCRARRADGSKRALVGRID